MGESSQILEIGDLVDRIDVLESIIEDLKRPKISQGELEISINQYAILEDSITKGIEYLSRNVKTVSDKKQLDTNTDKFNQVNSDFQENWNDDYWRCYNMIKGDDKKTIKYKADLTSRVAHLQDLASTLDKNIKDEKKKEVSEETSESKEIINKNDPITSRKCCNCLIY